MKQPGPLAAVTGGTGFLGRHVVAALRRRGWRVRLLVRRTPPDRLWDDVPGVPAPDLVRGDLSDSATLTRLVDGAQVVLHGAGLVKALQRGAFFETNEAGARRVAEATAAAAPGARMVLVSSLAAREPLLSDYAASKRAGEAAAAAVLGDRLAIVRPCAIYGEGDTEFLGLFRAASKGLLPRLPDDAARIAMVHASDAAEAAARVCDANAPLGVFEVTDARLGGYGWAELMAALQQAVGSRGRIVTVPPAALRAAAYGAALVARVTARPTLFTVGKARELLHADWSSCAARQLPPTVWSPTISLEVGFASTAQWYRERGWLKVALN